MSDLEDIRAARAALASVVEPGDLVLARLIGDLGPVETLRRLTDGAGPQPAVRAEATGGQGRPSYRAWARLATEQLHQPGTRVIIPEDPDWPEGLRWIPAGISRPICLWARGPGAVPQRTVVTVDGARACTAYGAHVAADLTDGLARRYHTVVTSGGYGIADAVARAALLASSPLVVVLGSGLDQPYPSGNRTLLDVVARDALLLTALPPDAVAGRGRLRAARRLAAQLGQGSVLVEAARHSGARITTEQSLALERPAMVVPGPVTSAMSQGCLDLLRGDERVRAVGTADDILADLRAGFGAPG